MAAIRGSHFVTRVVCVLRSLKWRVLAKLLGCAIWRIYSRKLTYMLGNRGKFVALIMTVSKGLLFCCEALNHHYRNEDSTCTSGDRVAIKNAC